MRAFFILTGITLTALVLGCWRMDHPGLYYDEMLFGNAAVGGKTDDFVRLRIASVPFLLMDYIGALKSWLYYPVFSLFPVGYWSVRVPALLIGLAGGLWLVAALWVGFGRSAALAGAVLILLDPTLITQARLDWGPNALMFFFRGLMVFSLVNWIKTGTVRWAWLALVAAGLGIFDKLNFLWISSSGAGALVLVYADTLRSFARAHRRHALALAVLAVGGLGAAAVRGILLAQHEDIGWPGRIGYALTLLRYVFCGGGALDFISGDGLRLERWILPGYLLTVLVALRGRVRDKRLYAWIWVFAGLLCVAFILTKSATGPHHASVLSGIWQLTLAPLLGAAWDNAPARWTVPVGLALAGAGCVIANVICIRAFDNPVNPNWDPANTRAALFARAYPEARFLCTDWGIGTLVITLTRDQPGAMDAWPAFTRPDDAVRFVRNLPRDKDLYIYTRLPGFENFKDNRANLLLALDSNHISHTVAARFPDRKGTAMIEIWRVPAAPK